MFIAPPKIDDGNDIYPSLGEIGFSALFLMAWLFPIIISWVVALSGLHFSYVAPSRQLTNLSDVGLLILISLLTGIVAAIIVLTLLRGMLKPNKVLHAEWRPHWIQLLFILILVLLSAIGVYKSFGGMIFYKSYSGPTATWLGYGAWSVTLLFALSFLIGEFISRRKSFLVVLFVSTAIYIPILLSGSRMDYLSLMIALSAYIYHLSDGGQILRAVKSIAIICFSVVISFAVGNIRYQNFKTPENIYEATFGIGLSGGDMFYLSTIGDIGASIFQIIGLIKEGGVMMVGAPKAGIIYLERLLPGPFFPDRPGDLAALLPEKIGGGALHSLGEAYLIGGMFGCLSLAALFGALAALSIFFGNRLKHSWSSAHFVVFLFPWLLLIRGGWYQLFSILKSMEIFFAICICLVTIGWLQQRLRGMGLRGRVC